MWRAVHAITVEQARVLCSAVPSVKLLHICMNLPPDAVHDLASVLRLPKLVRLHLSFSDEDASAAWFTDSKRRESNFRHLVDQACLMCPALKEASWSVYGGGGQDPQGPSLYIEVNNFSFIGLRH